LGKSLAEAVRRIGDEKVERGTNKGRSRLDVVIRGLFKQANKGNVKAAALLMDRGWGKALQPIGNEGGGPITIRIVEE
jgi:hypothetical protein